MYVLSECGTVLAEIGQGFQVYIDEIMSQIKMNSCRGGWWILLGQNHDLTNDEAKARLADVVEWLNAPMQTTLKGVMVNGVWTDEFIIYKPAVYDFGKPIGYWKEAR